MLRILTGLLLAAGLLLTRPATAAPAPEPARLPERQEDQAALAAATRALCSHRIALLGEAEHGDARTEAFKIALIGRLVERCGFRAVVFEASFYEFVALERARRAGQPVTEARLATAVGGLWQHNATFQPLLPWLAAQANSELVRLGGMDLQQGGRGQDYANFGLPAELTEPLPDARRDACRAAFREHLFKGFARDRLPVLQACLAEIRAAAEPAGARARREHRTILDMLGRFAAMDLRDKAGFIAARDQAMFDLLGFWQGAWPARTKVIVWTATAHAARDAGAAPSFAPVRNLGGLVAGRYRGAAYALGFSAAGGTTRGFPAARTIPPAEPDSLEHLALAQAGQATAFLDSSTLRRAGTRAGGLFNHDRLVLPWWQLVDGVVVFPADSAPTDIRRRD